jgi:hypothetical protein
MSHSLLTIKCLHMVPMWARENITECNFLKRREYFSTNDENFKIDYV